MTNIVDGRIAEGAAEGVAAAEIPSGGVAAHLVWIQVGRLDQLTPGRGAAALVGGQQVAVFRIELPGGGDQVFALGNRDPFSGAQVLARGIVGDSAGTPKVASPVYKQGFDLRTGVCLDDPAVTVPAYPVAVDDDGWISVGVPAP